MQANRSAAQAVRRKEVQASATSAKPRPTTDYAGLGSLYIRDPEWDGRV